MALSAEGKYQNFKASLENYVNANLVVTEQLAIDYEGVPFEEADYNEWVQVRIIGTGNWEDLHRSSSTRKKIAQPIVNFNVFVKPESTTKSNRHYQIRDIVAGYFELGSQIDFYDFASEDFTNVLQELTVKEIITDSPIPNDDFRQYNYTVGIEWIQKWT